MALCSALHYHHSLKSLRLSHCTIQDEGANAVKELLLINEIIEGYIYFNILLIINIYNII